MPDKTPNPEGTTTPTPEQLAAAATAVVDNASAAATREPITSLEQIPQALRTQIEMGHKKGLQAELVAAKEQLTNLNTLRENVSGFMEMLGSSVQLPEGSDLGDVAAQISGTLSTLQTDKEKAEAANLKQGELLVIAQKEAATNLASLHNTLIANELNSEIMGNDKATSKMTGKCIADAIAKFAKVGDNNAVTYEMEVEDENGHKAKQAIDVKQAVSIFEKNIEWKDFFKSAVNSGAGGDIGEGTENVQRTNDGTLDLGAMAATEEGVRKFMEIMEKTPELLNDVYKAAN